MHLEVLVEDESTAKAIEIIVPVLQSTADDSFRVNHFQGKQDMLAKLPGRFRGYAKWPFEHRVIVIIDQDRDDCVALKSRIEEMAHECGLATTARPERPWHLAVRIAMTELESWFLGDSTAIRAAFPRVDQRKVRTRGDVDALADAAERLARILRSGNYYSGGVPKVEVARLVSPHLDLDANRSTSFRVLIRTVREAFAA